MHMSGPIKDQTMILLSYHDCVNRSVASFLAIGDADMFISNNGVRTEVNVMEDIVGVGGLGDGWNCEDFLLDVNNGSWA